MATGDDTIDGSAINRRSLIVDEVAFEEQFLRCHVCREKFNHEERLPKCLPCNHTFCLPCLKQVFDHHQSNSRRGIAWIDDSFNGVLKCPTCRVEIFLSRSEISALPNDHRVIQMIDFLSQVIAKSQNLCSKHEQQSLNFFCKTCLLPVCRDCTVLDHKDNQGHNIVDVSDAMDESSDDFNHVENKSKQFLGKMKERSDALANASKHLDLLERQLYNDIKDTFIEYRLLLERRQRGMIDIVRGIIKDQKSQINKRFVEVCTEGSKLQKMYDTFTKARSDNDLKQLFTVRQEMKDREEMFAKNADTNDDALFVSCKFSVDNEVTFLAEMSGLGEVSSQPDLELKTTVPAHQLIVLDMENEQIRNDYTSRDISLPRDSHSSMDDDSLASTISSSITHGMGVSFETLSEVDEIMDSEERQSSYLLRLASRLNSNASDVADILMVQAMNDTELTSNESESTAASSSRSVRSHRPQDVRVVRHPHVHHSGYSSSRYTKNSENR